MEICPLSVKLSTIGEWTDSTCDSGFGTPDNDDALGLKTYHIMLYADDRSTLIEEGWYKIPSVILETDDFALESTYDIKFAHLDAQRWNWFHFDFTNTIAIPAYSYFEFEIISKDNGFPHDLGWGLVSYEKHQFGCRYKDAVDTEIATCTLTAGTTEDSAFVTIKDIRGSDSDITTEIAAGTVFWIELPKFMNSDFYPCE